jgi:propionate CoA-transferase
VVFVGTFALDDVEAVRRELALRLEPLGHKVYGVINYEHFALDAQVEDAWAAMVHEIVERHYLQVTRYTSSGFLRAKLGPALAARGVSPSLFGSADEARAHLHEPAGLPPARTP